jgi:hypothetical protein
LVCRARPRGHADPDDKATAERETAEPAVVSEVAAGSAAATNICLIIE